MRNTLKITALTAGLFLGTLSSNANASYVLDGDFSTPYGGSSYTTYGSSFGPWNVTSGDVDLIGGYWQSPTGLGTGSVDLDGSTPGAISQSLSTGPGSFLLTFSLSGNPDAGTGIKSLAVSVGNVIQQIFNYTVTGTNTHANMNYTTETLAFTTTGATNLVFASRDAAGAYGPVIGNVSISAVPLPAGLPMFAAALLAMVGFQSFRKRQAA